MSGDLHRVPTHPDVTAGSESLSSVKVWQPWIRTLHWTLVGSVITLSVTGYLIGNPVLAGGEGGNLLARIRFVHLLFAWLFVAVLVGRTFLAFTGNPWARWEHLVPVWSNRRAQLRHSVRYYLFLEKEPAEVVGHNPMAGLTYLAFFVLLLGQVLTGFALEGVADRTSWQHDTTSWLFDLLSVPTIRFVHHLIMWLVWTFVVFHIYAATLVDRVERGGEISSMVGGWKLLPGERVRAELAQDAAKRRKRYRP
jgi:Ni/Fe-hydrogenase 1 B-type cytochrome subunit